MIELPPGLTVEALHRGWFANLDPGMIHPAIALFHHGFLRCARRVKVPGWMSKLPLGERCRQIVNLIGAACAEIMVTELPVALVTERPQVYAGAKSKTDPNDLIPLAMINGGVAQGFGCPVISPTPREWAGATQKATTGDPFESPRGDIVRSLLSAEELALCESSHDAIDACMMGLKVLGRIRRHYARS